MEVTRGTPFKFLYKITASELEVYEQNSVYFTIPKIVAYYEDYYGKTGPAARILYFKELRLPQYRIDLNDRHKMYRFRQASMYSKYIELSLKYAMSPMTEHDGHNDAVERTLVYTRRGTLLHIMQSNYVKKRNWSIRVSRYVGNIYMAREELDESKNKKSSSSTHHLRLLNELFAESPNQSPQIDKPCDENIGLVGVHRSTLGKYDIIYSGEIQGIIADEEFKDFDDMEALNKCHFVLSKQLWNTLKYDDNKFLNYWLQAYLSNVKDLYVAFKNKDGIVEEPIVHQIVSNLPKNRFWKPKICTSFLHDFLERVERLMANVNCLNTVYVFHYNGKEKTISYKIYKGKTDKTFITQEYMDYCKKNII